MVIRALVLADKKVKIVIRGHEEAPLISARRMYSEHSQNDYAITSKNEKIFKNQSK